MGAISFNVRKSRVNQEFPGERPYDLHTYFLSRPRSERLCPSALGISNSGRSSASVLMKCRIKQDTGSMQNHIKMIFLCINVMFKSGLGYGLREGTMIVC